MSASTLTSWARTVRRALRDTGCDAGALFRAAGLDPAKLSDPQARYPIARSTQLWQLAVDATGNEAFGFAAARRAEITSFHALGFAVMASPTLAALRALFGSGVGFRQFEYPGWARAHRHRHPAARW